MHYPILLYTDNFKKIMQVLHFTRATSNDAYRLFHFIGALWAGRVCSISTEDNFFNYTFL